jgi:hypothetical protein
MKILLLAPLVQQVYIGKDKDTIRPQGFVHGLVEAFTELGHEVTPVPTSGVYLGSKIGWDRSSINNQKWLNDIVSKSQDHDTVFISKGTTIEMPWFQQLAERCPDTTYFDMDPTSGNGCGPDNRPQEIGARGLLCTRITATGTEGLRWFRNNGFSGRTAQIYEGYRPHLWPVPDRERQNQNRISFLGTRGYTGDGGRRDKLDRIESEGHELLQNRRTFYEEAATTYYDSAICPNFVCGDITSLRVVHILASCGFCLTEHNVDVEASFTRGQELDWFDFNNTDEMLEKIQFYMSRPELRDEIARRGHEWAREYTWNHQTEKMVRFIQGSSVCDGGAEEFVS